jgi:hypothetical protein
MLVAFYWAVVTACLAVLAVFSVIVGSAVFMACTDIWRRVRMDRNSSDIWSLGVAVFVLASMVVMCASIVLVIV